VYYVFEDEYGRPGFKIEGQNEIDHETDRPIPYHIYNKFFELQEQGVNLKLKESTALNSHTFEEIFEEYEPRIPEEILEEIEAEKAKENEVSELKNQISELQNLVQTLLDKEQT
jgi:hypothetical protein